MSMTVYVDYDSESWETRPQDPDDDWDNGDSEGRYWVTGVTLTPGMRDACEVTEDISAGDTVHVVYVSYNSGSTFGTDGGYGQVVAVTKDADLARRAEGWAEYSYSWPQELGREPYRAWDGYFEWGQAFYTDTFEVRP